MVCFAYFFYDFSPPKILGEDVHPFLTHIFSDGLHETTNQPCFFVFYLLFLVGVPRSRVVSLRSLGRYLSSSLPYCLAAHGRRPGLLGCGLPGARRQRGAANGGDQGECSKPNGGPKDSEDVASGEDVT